jgi:cellulose synthase operon protein YhjQ
MKVVAVIGVTGGAGATTTAASLSAALALQKRATLAFDFCATNVLRLHFGMSWADESGFAVQLLRGQDWHAAAWRDGKNRPFVPFGALADDAELERLTQWLRERPRWFKEQLASVQLEADTIVVCDCPLMPSALRDQVLAAADLALLVCAPDTVSYARTTHIVAATTQAARVPKALIVLNGFDSARRLDRDIALLLRTQYRQVFSPVLVHRDESLREALACKQTVFDFAPASQAAYDHAALATWTLARLGQQSGVGRRAA